MHRTRTKLEAAVCAEMERQGLPHEHRNLKYRVRMASGKVAVYRPAISVQRGPLLFLVEPASLAPGTLERTTRFLDQHSPEIVFAAVAPARIAGRLPPEGYDELYEDTRVPDLVRRIREQDPAGPVRPFRKPRSTGSS